MPEGRPAYTLNTPQNRRNLQEYESGSIAKAAEKIERSGQDKVNLFPKMHFYIVTCFQ